VEWLVPWVLITIPPVE